MVRNQVEQAAQLVEWMKRQIPLLRVVDRYLFKNLLKLAIGELAEFSDEFQPYTTQAAFLTNIEVAAGEFHDILVFLLSYVHAKDWTLDYASLDPASLNGLGAHSNALERARESIGNTSDLPGIKYSLGLVLSIGKNAPVPISGLETFAKTIGKVMRNYPPALFDSQCPVTGKNLDGQEAIEKYGHVVTITKMIRKQLGRTLTEADWQPYYWLAVDWQGGDQNVETVRKHLSGEISDDELRVTAAQICEKAKAKASA